MDASSHIDRLIADLAERQHGVVTREQLLTLGLGRGALGHRVSRGALHVIHAGVDAVGHAVLTADGRRMAAVLACGDGAALSHQSAAERHGLLRDQGARHHVSIRGRSGRDRDGIRIHRPRTLTEDEITTVDGIPITTVERTLLDVAAVVTRTRLERARDEAERQGAVDRAQTLLLVDRHRRHRDAGRLHGRARPARRRHRTHALEPRAALPRPGPRAPPPRARRQRADRGRRGRRLLARALAAHLGTLLAA